MRGRCGIIVVMRKVRDHCCREGKVRDHCCREGKVRDHCCHEEEGAGSLLS